MKYRIIASALLVMILVGIYVLFSSAPRAPAEDQQSNSSASSTTDSQSQSQYSGFGK